MIELEVSRILIDDSQKEQVVVLKERKGKRYLSIAIGLAEASAIKSKVSSFTPPRPLTHDLMFSIISNLQIKLEKVVIDKIAEGTFHAKLHLSDDNNGPKIIDARPSDSIALALRTNSPIFAEETVLAKFSG